MLLGIITDIHEEVDFLQEALATLAERKVDQIVCVGDVVGPCLRLRETCRLLAESQVVGVYGNHDYGLSVDQDDEVAALCGGSQVAAYMRTLEPRLVIEDCLFQHIEPWLDPSKLEDLWYFDGVPQRPEQLARIFAVPTARVLFAGHFHRWLWARPTELTDWNGEAPVCLAPAERHFVIVGPLCHGQFATYDTSSGWLTPATCLGAGMA